MLYVHSFETGERIYEIPLEVGTISSFTSEWDQNFVRFKAFVFAFSMYFSHVVIYVYLIVNSLTVFNYN